VSRLGFKKMWDWNDDDAREMRRGYAYARAHAFWSGTPDQNVEKVFVGLECATGFLVCRRGRPSGAHSVVHHSGPHHSGPHGLHVLQHPVHVA
jgi:hypothetical protein